MMPEEGVLEAGPELDRLVHLRVMGLEPAVMPAIPAFHERDLKIEPGEVYVADPVPLRFLPCPEYSTDIARAWEVAEKMRLLVSPMDGGWFAGRTSERTVDADPVGRGAYIDWDFGGNEYSIADTAPHAICLAAMKAVGC